MMPLVLLIYAMVTDMIKDIQDPEKPETLEELAVVYEEGIQVRRAQDGTYHISIEFTPTVPHCSLATLIGKYSIDSLFPNYTKK